MISAWPSPISSLFGYSDEHIIRRYVHNGQTSYQIYITYRFLTIQNISDLDFDLSMPFKVKGTIQGTIGLPYIFINSNMWPNTVPLPDIRRQIWVTLTLTF